MNKKHLLRKPNILAVDDYPANLIALDAVLTDYNVIHANSGAEALSVVLSRKDIDLVLMDIQMPEMDGYEASTRIKQVPGYGDIPIIFITAIFKEDPHIRKGYESGGIDYFSKPFDPEILKMKVGVYATLRQRGEILRQREQQLLETEELLRAGRKLSSVLESLTAGVLIADVEGRVCQMNEQVARICRGIKSESDESYGEILGWWDSSGKMIKDQSGPLGTALQEGKSSHNKSIEIRCCDGTTKMILCSASPLRGLDGHIVGAVVVIQDLTEPKKIEIELQRQITRLVSDELGDSSEAPHL